MLPDFNRLRVFYHVYQNHSSTKAARILHITQSGVSQQIKKLEEELECKLFNRINRKLIPNTAANRLFQVVDNFVAELEKGVREVHSGIEYPSGLLRIGAAEEFGKRYLPSIMASFSSTYPEVTFQLELGGPLTLSKKLMNNDVDFIYGDILPINLKEQRQGNIESTPLIKEKFVLVCSREYMDQMKVRNNYDNLCRLNYIGYKKDIGLFRSWFELNFKKAPKKLNQSIVADSTEVIIQSLLMNTGLAIIVSHFITDHLQSGRLVPITVKEKQLENTIAIFRRQQCQPTVTEEYFHHHLLDSLQQYPDLDLYE